MVQCTCMVQEGQIADRNEAELREALKDFADRAFGVAVSIRWVAIPAGSGFTAAQPSTSSVVGMTAPQPLDQSHRVALLKELCDIWMDGTGCSLDEIVASISDPR